VVGAGAGADGFGRWNYAIPISGAAFSRRGARRRPSRPRLETPRPTSVPRAGYYRERGHRHTSCAFMCLACASPSAECARLRRGAVLGIIFRVRCALPRPGSPAALFALRPTARRGDPPKAGRPTCRRSSRAPAGRRLGPPGVGPPVATAVGAPPQARAWPSAPAAALGWAATTQTQVQSSGPCASP